MVEHHTHLYADLRDPIALLRGEMADTELGRYWAYANTDAPEALKVEQVAPYSTLMALSLPLVAEEVLDAYPVSRHRALLDVGGGEGVFLAAAASRAPKLSLMLFDVPAVAERARESLAKEGLAARSQIFGGDFLSDSLPNGADLITLVRVILDHDDAHALKILKAARAALDARRYAAHRRAARRHRRRRGHGWRLFRLLPAGHGWRTAAHSGSGRRPAAKGRIQPNFLPPRTTPVAHRHRRRPSLTLASVKLS